MLTTEQVLRDIGRTVLPRELSSHTKRSLADTNADLKRLAKQGKAEDVGGRWRWKPGAKSTAPAVPSAVKHGPAAIRMVLKEEGQASVKTLARKTGFSEAEVRGALSHLEVAGLAKRVRTDTWKWTGEGGKAGKAAGVKKVEICSCSERLRDNRTGRFVKGAR